MSVQWSKANDGRWYDVCERRMKITRPRKSKTSGKKLEIGVHMQLNASRKMADRKA
jgi:hypothetical protein